MWEVSREEGKPQKYKDRGDLLVLEKMQEGSEQFTRCSNKDFQEPACTKLRVGGHEINLEKKVKAMVLDAESCCHFWTVDTSKTNFVEDQRTHLRTNKGNIHAFPHALEKWRKDNMEMLTTDEKKKSKKSS